MFWKNNKKTLFFIFTRVKVISSANTECTRVSVHDALDACRYDNGCRILTIAVVLLLSYPYPFPRNAFRIEMSTRGEASLRIVGFARFPPATVPCLCTRIRACAYTYFIFVPYVHEIYYNPSYTIRVYINIMMCARKRYAFRTSPLVAADVRSFDGSRTPRVRCYDSVMCRSRFRSNFFIFHTLRSE